MLRDVSHVVVTLGVTRCCALSKILRRNAAALLGVGIGSWALQVLQSVPNSFADRTIRECASHGEALENNSLPYQKFVPSKPYSTMFAILSSMNADLTDYATEYTSTRDTYLAAAKALKEATGPYKATRDAYVAATATYTKSLYE